MVGRGEVSWRGIAVRQAAWVVARRCDRTRLWQRVALYTPRAASVATQAPDEGARLVILDWKIARDVLHLHVAMCDLRL